MWLRHTPSDQIVVDVVGGTAAGPVEGDAVWVHAPEVMKRLQIDHRKQVEIRAAKTAIVIAILETATTHRTHGEVDVRLYRGMDLLMGRNMSALFGTRHSKADKCLAVIAVSRLVPWTVAAYQRLFGKNP